MSRFPRSRAAIVALAAAACVGPRGVQYVGPRMEVHAPQALLIDTIALYAVQQSWTVVRASAANNVIEALTPAVALGEAQMRDRWRFTITPPSLRADKVLEVRFRQDEPWTSSARVCADYRYTAEREHLAAIADLLQQAALATDAAVSLTMIQTTDDR